MPGRPSPAPARLGSPGLAVCCRSRRQTPARVRPERCRPGSRAGTLSAPLPARGGMEGSAGRSGPAARALLTLSVPGAGAEPRIYLFFFWLSFFFFLNPRFRQLFQTSRDGTTTLGFVPLPAARCCA